MNDGKYVDTIMSEEGVKQGDTLGSLLFCLSMQHLYRRCTEGIPGVTCVAVADDLNLVGSPEGVFRAFTKFDKSLHSSGLVVRREKCGVLWPSLSAPPPESVRSPAARLGLTLHCGVMQTLGVLVGSDDSHINEWLARQVASHQPFLDSIAHPELPAQVAMLLPP